MAGEVKERMDECVVRRRGAVAHWHGRMENRKRSHDEGRVRKKKFLKRYENEERASVRGQGAEKRREMESGCAQTL